MPKRRHHKVNLTGWAQFKIYENLKKNILKIYLYLWSGQTSRKFFVFFFEMDFRLYLWMKNYDVCLERLIPSSSYILRFFPRRLRPAMGFRVRTCRGSVKGFSSIGQVVCSRGIKSASEYFFSLGIWSGLFFFSSSFFFFLIFFLC